MSSDGDIQTGDLEQGKGAIRALNCWKPYSTNGQVAIDLGESLLHQHVNIAAGQPISFLGVDSDSSDPLGPRIVTLVSIPYSVGNTTEQNYFFDPSNDLLL